MITLPFWVGENSPLLRFVGNCIGQLGRARSRGLCSVLHPDAWKRDNSPLGGGRGDEFPPFSPSFCKKEKSLPRNWKSRLFSLPRTLAGRHFYLSAAGAAAVGVEKYVFLLPSSSSPLLSLSFHFRPACRGENLILLESSSLSLFLTLTRTEQFAAGRHSKKPRKRRRRTLFQHLVPFFRLELFHKVGTHREGEREGESHCLVLAAPSGLTKLGGRETKSIKSAGPSEK